MKSRLDSLKLPTDIQYRSQTKIASQAAKILVNPQAMTLMVSFLSGDELQIQLPDVDTVKPKDYPKAGGGNVFLLTISYHEECQSHGQGAQSSLEFSDRDVRDLWDHGLRSLLTNAGNEKQQVSVPTQKLLPIQSISLQGGDKDLNVVVDLGSRHGTFPVPMPSNGDRETYKNDLWKGVLDFVDQAGILQTESMSLFRYVRCVVQRSLMEQEVKDVIEEINKQSLVTLMEKRGEKQPGVLDDHQLHQAAEKRLDVIDAELVDRIHQGNGAAVVVKVLKRNIAKMKLMNDLALKLALDEAGN